MVPQSHPSLSISFKMSKCRCKKHSEWIVDLQKPTRIFNIIKGKGSKEVRKGVFNFIQSHYYRRFIMMFKLPKKKKKAESIINSHEKESNIEEFCLICDKLITLLNGFNVNEFQDTAVKSRIQTLLFTLGNSIRGEVYKHGLSLSGFIKFSYVERS